MKALADSSFLVALFFTRDINHDKAIKLLEHIEKIFIHPDVLKETLTVLMYRTGNVKEIYSEILENEMFEITDFSVTDVFDFWLNINKRVSYVDGLVVFLAFKTGLELLTFDKEQKRILKTYEVFKAI
jgi:predicted nucleic acid-binding protein